MFFLSDFKSLLTYFFFPWSLKEGTLNWEMLQFKSRFPREILLCRVCLPRLASPRLESLSLFSNLSVLHFHYMCIYIYLLPMWVLFLQVGDFYEAIGIDACILVEYAGLNPFGGLRSDSIPRAGCPVVVKIHIFSLSFSWFLCVKMIFCSTVRCSKHSELINVPILIFYGDLGA